MARITPKQARFIDEYLVDGNGTRAAIAAGYGRAGARVTAHRLLTKAAIRASIQARQAEDARRLQIERQDLISGLLEAVEMGRERREPMAMITALREIGRMLGYYAPAKVHVETTSDPDKNLRRFEAMCDEELAAVISGHRYQSG